MIEHAKRYLNAGLSVLPAKCSEKRPSLVSWKPYQTRRPTLTEIDAWFSHPPDGLCIVAGAVSGNLEMMDFDCQAELFEKWKSLVAQAAPEILSRLVIESSQSGGCHVIYRCQTEVGSNMKLAQRKIAMPNEQEFELCGKKYKPHKDVDGTWFIILTLIETRGEGGLFLCAPTPGYELLQGDLADLPILSSEQRERLLEAAWALNEFMPEPVPDATSATSKDGLRPGDDYNTRGDVRTLLQSHGWTCVKSGDNEYWRRPGKSNGWSATLKNNVFYVWSTNASPFESQKPYAPFSVYTILEHHGDYSKAAAALLAQGYGEHPSESAPSGVDISGLIRSFENKDPQQGRFADPGPTPNELLRVPGYISQVMDFCMEISAYPNQAMAFCGAVALQSFLCGRKVREKGDLRPNIYLLALAGASTGKDYPRKINAHILTQIGQTNCLGDKFASGEGLQDAMFQTPCMLFQNDEVDTMLQSFNKSRDGHLESIMSTLLTMYTTSNSVYPMRRKAGKQPAGFIDQPHLTLFGTATPKYYYSALSERMLTNGFIARIITIDVGKRSTGKDAGIIGSMPEAIIDTARWWSDYKPGQPRNLIDVHPVPAIVDYTDDGRRVLNEFRTFADAEYAKAEDSNDEVSKTVWGRANENARKLALLYACSENHLQPQISSDAAKWSVELMTHQLRRMLALVQLYVADNDFHASCLKLKQKLREAKGWTLPHSVLLKRMKIDTKSFQSIIDTLVSQDDLEVLSSPTKTNKCTFYHLVEE